jgi:predicted alpha/beta-hydrolase family hydrolase
MQRSVAVVCAVLVLLSAAVAGASDTIKVPTPRGAPIEILEDRPAGNGPFPAVILGSGAGYTMKLAILERVAQALVAQGIAVFRFNWAYEVKDPGHGTQSKDRSAETEDMTTVLALARKQTWVDPNRLAVGGKSLGSIIAWRVLRAEPDVKGALLLTPVCSPPGPTAIPPEANYPDVASEARPSAWVLGDHDVVCRTPILYKFVAAEGGPARVDVVAGNHTFEDAPPAPDPSAAARTERTIDLVARLSAEFVSSLLASSARP